jgi:hypothetical protein
MRLTPRGERLTLAILLITTGAALVFAAWLGQEWKRDRIEHGTIDPQSITCAEDDPCWNCHTMGNGECGHE